MLSRRKPDLIKLSLLPSKSSPFLMLVLLIICANFGLTSSKKADPENKPAWAKKDIRDFDDADLERLLDQWEVIGNCLNAWVNK